MKKKRYKQRINKIVVKKATLPDILFLTIAQCSTTIAIGGKEYYVSHTHTKKCYTFFSAVSLYVQLLIFTKARWYSRIQVLLC